jgi:hypothetical protein
MVDFITRKVLVKFYGAIEQDNGNCVYQKISQCGVALNFYCNASILKKTIEALRKNLFYFKQNSTLRNQTIDFNKLIDLNWTDFAWALITQ